MIDENLLLGFVGGLISVLGGVWTAYRLLGYSVYRELDQQRERINMLQNQVNKDAENASERISRETEARHQTDRESVVARLKLGSRIQYLETELRRSAGNIQDDATTNS
ncbi:MAG: hypothetical protein OXG68_00050 [Chloroflexi bacterium]|nr:hypothetical protein [Chloroflexota bacterium]